ncbi:MFS transporter [Candidatus Ruminimicrobium bovinum]|uniref:MFS transporter n=1 Tax=Candidatus Ruminimicrobium bovinum TaxID=3242779 RepID=UPI0039B826DE
MFKKAVSIISLFAYLITVLIPQNIFANSPIPKQPLSEIPQLSVLNDTNLKFGKLFETNITDYKTKPDVLIILDMHCQPYVQKNICSIIKYFDTRFDVDKIFIEGAPKGYVDISAFDNIDNDIKQKVFEKMLKNGLLSGGEYFSYLEKKSKLYGIENFELYKKSLQKYYLILKNKIYLLSAINTAQKNIKKQKLKFYSDDMLIYDKIFSYNNFEQDKNLILLKNIINKTGVELKNYPDIEKFILIKQYEQQLKKEKYDTQTIQHLLAMLKTKMPFNKYNLLLNNLKNKTVEESLIYIYDFAGNFLEKNSLGYINVLYNKYRIEETFSINNFLKEKEVLQNDIREKLFKQENISKLVFADEYLKLLKKYAELKLNFNEATQLFSDKDKFKNIVSTSNFIKNKKEILEITDNEILQSYYLDNIKRNSIFVDNITAEINKEKTSIIITGGFHKNIIDIMEKQNLKYAVIMPNSVKNNYTTYNNVLSDIVIYNFNALSDGLFVTGISVYKIKTFLSLLTEELKLKKLTESQISEFIKNIINKNKNLFNKINSENFIYSIKNFSLKTLFIKTKQFVSDIVYKLKFNFEYEYNSDDESSVDKKTIKNMQNNVRFFMLMQLVLGFNLFVSFDTLFMQASGYSLALISLVFAVLSPVTFVTSIIGGMISDKVSDRNIIVAALILQTIGTVFFAFSGTSVLLFIASQVIPAIAIALNSLTSGPFLYKSLDNMKQTDKFEQLYGFGLSLKWAIMATSSLIGGLVAAYLSNEFCLILLTAIPSIAASFASLKFTHSERITSKAENKKFSIKDNLSGFMQPLKQLYTQKESLGFVITNIIVNNIFFVVMCFFLQPVIFTTGTVFMLAPVYFAANILQAASSYFISKTNFISKNKIPRNIFFIATAGLFGLFIVTGNPFLFMGIYLLMNLWQASATLTETSVVYDMLDDNIKTKWQSFKLITGMLVSAVTQVSISGLLAAGFSNNSIIAGAVAILTASSILLSALFKDKQNKNNEISEPDTDIIKQILSCA